MPFITQQVNNAKDFITRVHVRAVLALIFTVGLTIGFFLDKIEPTTYKDVTLIALVWYFTKRQSDSEN